MNQVKQQHQINNIKEIWNKKEKAKQKNVHIL